MPSPASRFRFSLRALLLLVAVVAVGCLWYRAHREFVRSPSRSDAGGGYSRTGDPQHLRTRSFRDREDRLVAVVVLAFDELDASGPRFSLDHRYDAQTGGRLLLNGQEVLPRSRPRVFINDPLGNLAEVDLAPADAEALASAQSADVVRSLVQKSIEPQLIDSQGHSDAKGRQGLWTFRLKSGELLREVTYVDGLRHGAMATYYRSGRKKSQQSFFRGLPEGQWTFFDPQGKILAVIDPRSTEDSPSAVRWQSHMDDQQGYRLFVGGAELRLPQ